MDPNTPLTQMVAAAGCAAKLGPQELAAALAGIAACVDPRMLVGPETLDDAAVIRLNDDLALCFTTDFITPLVDDPYNWGRIAATNALSDVYAMGGVPLVALNLVCWCDCLPVSTLRRVLEGGAQAAREAQCMIGGGHSVQDREPKYGMAVVGTVSPSRVVRNQGALAGDLLYLSKPLGTGILCTALKAQDAQEVEIEAAVASMTTLNRAATEAAIRGETRAMTDVTGFGLVGHLNEMLGKTGLGVRVSAAALPQLPGVARHVSLGLIPAGAGRNRKAFSARVVFSATVGDVERVLVFDPQTSGGILAAIPPASKERYEDAARELGVAAVRIGEFDDSGSIAIAS